MSRTSRERDWNGLAIAICALSFGVVCYLLVPELANGGGISTGNLVLALPFGVIALFCFQLGLESLPVDDGQSRGNRDRSRID